MTDNVFFKKITQFFMWRVDCGGRDWRHGGDMLEGNHNNPAEREGWLTTMVAVELCIVIFIF